MCLFLHSGSLAKSNASRLILTPEKKVLIERIKKYTNLKDFSTEDQSLSKSVCSGCAKRLERIDKEMDVEKKQTLLQGLGATINTLDLKIPRPLRSSGSLELETMEDCPCLICVCASEYCGTIGHKLAIGSASKTTGRPPDPSKPTSYKHEKPEVYLICSGCDSRVSSS